MAAALDVAEGSVRGLLSLRMYFRIERLRKEGQTGPFTHACITEGKGKLSNILPSQIKLSINVTDDEICLDHLK